MFDSSVIELSKSALNKNLRFLRNEIGPDVLISSVIKGNAYGHGIDAFVPLAEECGIKSFAVFDANEAYQAVKYRTNPNTDIMAMGYIDADGIEWAIENGVSFYVFDLERMKTALKKANKIGLPARVHLELETGMNRIGLDDDGLNKTIQLIQQNPDLIKIEGVCTHYAGAESIANYKRIREQKREFNQLCRLINKKGLDIPKRHTASSAAAIIYPETRMEMVRIGIMQYGFWPSKETEMQYVMRDETSPGKAYKDPLRRVLKWKSKVMSIKKIKAGRFVGYGTSYMTLRPQVVASVPVGYSHGFRRSLSNLGRVLIQGHRANVIGVVNMSMMLVDVTSIPGVKTGDEVVIIGKQKNARITVGSFSDIANLLNYEMLVRLPANIPRVIVK